MVGSFLSVVSSCKPSHPSLPVSLGARHIKEYLNNKRWSKRKLIQPHQEKARHEERMKQSKVIFRSKLVVGYRELIPMESWSGLSSP